VEKGLPPPRADKNRKKICLKIKFSSTKCNGELLARGNGGENITIRCFSVESGRRQEERNTRKGKSERKEEWKKNTLVCVVLIVPEAITAQGLTSSCLLGPDWYVELICLQYGFLVAGFVM